MLKKFTHFNKAQNICNKMKRNKNKEFVMAAWTFVLSRLGNVNVKQSGIKSDLLITF